MILFKNVIAYRHKIHHRSHMTWLSPFISVCHRLCVFLHEYHLTDLDADAAIASCFLRVFSTNDKMYDMFTITC